MLNRDYYAVPLYWVWDEDSGGGFHYFKSRYTIDLREYGDGFSGYESKVIGYVSRHAIPGLDPVYRTAPRSGLNGGVEYERLSMEPFPEGSWEQMYSKGILAYALPLAIPVVSGVTALKEYEFERAIGTNLVGYTEYGYDYYLGSSPPDFYVTPAYVSQGPALAVWNERVAIQSVTLAALPTTVAGRSQLQVQWRTKRGDGYIRLLYSVDDGTTWAPISDFLPNPATRAGVYNSFTWSVPNVATAELRIKAEWYPGKASDALAWASSPKMTITRNTLYPIFLMRDAVSVLSSKPAAPTNLIAAVPAPSTLAPEIRLYWTDNSHSETSYLVRRWEKSNPVPTLWTCGLPADTEQYKNTGIVPGVEYVYEVIARGQQDSTPSNQVTAIYLAEGQTVPYLLTIQPPSPPSGLSAAIVAGTVSDVRLTWTPNPAALPAQELQRKIGGSEWSLLAEVAGTAASYVDRSIPTGTTGEISYRAFARGAVKVSNPSNVATVVLPASVPAEPEQPNPPPTYDGSQSDWAQAEITQAHQLGLTYPGVMYEYQRKITREEFCTVAVKLYEKLSGKAAVAGEDPFGDTDNPDILKAFALGIVRGVGATQFAPANNITRQEMCVMIYRALQAAGENTLLLPGGEFSFGDLGQIASWALNEVRFCYQKQIMKGTSPTTISPLVNTPREQAIVLIYRTYQAFK